MYLSYANSNSVHSVVIIIVLYCGFDGLFSVLCENTIQSFMKGVYILLLLFAYNKPMGMVICSFVCH